MGCLSTSGSRSDLMRYARLHVETVIRSATGSVALSAAPCDTMDRSWAMHHGRGVKRRQTALHESNDVLTSAHPPQRPPQTHCPT